MSTILLPAYCYAVKPEFQLFWKEGNALFNDTLNTFYLRLYYVGHMVKGNSDSERKPAAAT